MTAPEKGGINLIVTYNLTTSTAKGPKMKLAGKSTKSEHFSPTSGVSSQHMIPPREPLRASWRGFFIGILRASYNVYNVLLESRCYVKLVIALIIFSTPAKAEMVTASFYTRESAQKEGTSGVYTASGERFKEHLQTCAHPSLPFNTILKVTNPKNGIWFYCRVNDRGPSEYLAIQHRKLDMTPKGFELLKINPEDGLANVKIERVRK